MSLRKQIERLESARLSESEIVLTLGITHLAYRRTASAVTERLPKGAKAELYYSDIREDLSLSALASLYKTTHSQVHMAIYNKPAQKRVYTKDLALAHLQKHDDIPLLAKTFSISKKALPHVLKELGWHYTPPPQDYNSEKAHKILKFIREDPKLTYKEIAMRIPCNHTYVTHVAQSRGIHRQTQGQHNWSQILAYAQSNSILAAATHFGVSRASIYYHMRK